MDAGDFRVVVAFVVVCLVAESISFASATVIFSDGFESGDFSAWTGVKDYSPVVVSDVVYDGSYAAFCNDTGIRVCYKEVTPVNHLFIRAYYRFGAMPTEWSNRGLGYFVEDDMVRIVAMFEIAHWTGSDYIWAIEALNGTDLQIVDSSGFTLDVSHWYCMELEMFVDGSAGYTKLYVDNVLVVSLEGVDNDCYGPIGRAGAGSVWENRKNEPVWWDCCVIADSYIGTNPEPTPTPTPTGNPTPTPTATPIPTDVPTSPTPTPNPPQSPSPSPSASPTPSPEQTSEAGGLPTGAFYAGAAMAIVAVLAISIIFLKRRKNSKGAGDVP